jgi:arsenate reductase
MAEAWTRHLRGGEIEAASAGLEARGLDPRLGPVMAEVGVSLSGQRSKRVDEVDGRSFDVVVTVCGHAYGHCPVPPGDARVVHVPFDDPPSLARSAGSEEEALDHYRRVRDEIRAFVERLPDSLDDGEGA